MEIKLFIVKKTHKFQPNYVTKLLLSAVRQVAPCNMHHRNAPVC